jgi:hypothetical protein
VLVVANVDTVPHHVRLSAVVDGFGETGVTLSQLTLDPAADEADWSSWSSRPAVVLPVGGRISVDESVGLAAHVVHLIKLVPHAEEGDG